MNKIILIIYTTLMLFPITFLVKTTEKKDEKGIKSSLLIFFLILILGVLAI